MSKTDEVIWELEKLARFGRSSSSARRLMEQAISANCEWPECICGEKLRHWSGMMQHLPVDLIETARFDLFYALSCAATRSDPKYRRHAARQLTHRVWDPVRFWDPMRSIGPSGGLSDD